MTGRDGFVTSIFPAAHSWIDYTSAMDAYPDGARLEKGPGGLDRLALHAAEGEALVYLQGAHVAAFQPKDEKPILWMSAASRFEGGRRSAAGCPSASLGSGRRPARRTRRRTATRGCSPGPTAP